MTANRIAGKAIATSVSRISPSSAQRPCAEAVSPMPTPTSAPSPTDRNATRIELCAPTISSDSTSRPSWSVPSQWAAEGGWNRLPTSMVRVL